MPDMAVFASQLGLPSYPGSGLFALLAAKASFKTTSILGHVIHGIQELSSKAFPDGFNLS